MSWLIKRRGTIAGWIDRGKAQLKELESNLGEWHQQLAAIDAVICIHEVKILNGPIPAIRPRKPRMAPHGLITKFTLRYLREARGEQRLTTEIAMAFARQYGIDLAAYTRDEIVESITGALKHLEQKKLVVRYQSASCTGVGPWSLADVDQLA